MTSCELPLQVWRHPRPKDVAGRCIGAGTDVPVDARKAKRLARRIQAMARRHRWPHIVITSPLRRCANVGRCLRRWGWRHLVDPALREMDFGAWEGRAWSGIDITELDNWCARFDLHAPGGGECLQAFMDRVSTWAPPPDVPVAMVVGHAGWMLARRWVQQHGGQAPARAADWPVPPVYGIGWDLSSPGQGLNTAP